MGWNGSSTYGVRVDRARLADSATAATTATKLATARTIAISGGATGTATSFDGAANIAIPVTALDASKATAGILPAARLSGTYGIAISGNAATATQLATARTINGVSFNGTANITVEDSTKLPLAGGTLTGGINIPALGMSWIGGLTSTVPINQNLGTNTTSYFPIIKQVHSANTFNLGGYNNGFGFYRYANTRTDNGTDSSFYMNSAGDMVASGKVYTTGLKGTTSIRMQTDSGYIDFGPQNTSYAHIYTDRPSFYFNKELLVNGNKVWHAGNDGSGSGLDADLLDGVQLATLRNEMKSAVPSLGGDGGMVPLSSNASLPEPSSWTQVCALLGKDPTTTTQILVTFPTSYVWYDYPGEHPVRHEDFTGYAFEYVKKYSGTKSLKLFYENKLGYSSYFIK